MYTWLDITQINIVHFCDKRSANLSSQTWSYPSRALQLDTGTHGIMHHTASSLLAAASLLGTASAASNASLVLLSDKYPRAKCLDGSPFGLYWRDSKDGLNKNVIVYFQGGGFSTVLDMPALKTSSAASRANTMLGSSLQWPSETAGNVATDGFCCSTGGMLSDDPLQNPHMHDWALAFLGYCDGSSFTSDVDEPLPVNTSNANGDVVYVRGKANLDAALAYLTEEKGVAAADDVVLGGCSAGGAAVYLHLDYVASRLPGVNVRGMGDAGFLQNLAGEAGTNFTHVRFANATGFWGNFSSNSGCQQAFPVGTSEAWRCLVAEYVYPHIASPVFVLAAMYDDGLAGAWGGPLRVGTRQAHYGVGG